MNGKTIFLSATWSDIVIVTYQVPASVVKQHLPSGLEPDTREGSAYISLVGLTFVETRVLGIGWPGFRTFPELNLRVYVKRGDERGVLFIRELVPSPLVAWLARTLYNEPYEANPLSVHVRHEEAKIEVEYVLDRGGSMHRMRAVGSKPPSLPGDDSLEHFLKEHRWGFGRDRRGRLLQYEVEHPVWTVYGVTSLDVNLDWGKVYGGEWDFLSAGAPISAIIAVGSPISVFSLMGGFGNQ